MINVTEYLNRKHSKDYTCFSLVLEVYPELKSFWIPDTSVKNQLLAVKKSLESNIFEKIDKPNNGDLVLLNKHHIGIYIDGYVLHTQKIQNTSLEPINKIKREYKTVEFYRVNTSNTIEGKI